MVKCFRDQTTTSGSKGKRADAHRTLDALEKLAENLDEDDGGDEPDEKDGASELSGRAVVLER
jgi:hypothetical protein